MAVNVGDKAPSFTLINTEKAEVALEDYKGKKRSFAIFSTGFYRRLH